MSFISKLFRRSEQGEDAEVAPEQPDDPAPLAAPSAQAPAPPAAEAPADPAEGAEASPAAPPADNWWDEATEAGSAPTPAAVLAAPTPAANGTAPPAEAIDAPPTRAAPSTQPLDPARVAPSPAPAEEEEPGTRPLTAADMPTLAALRSRRGLACAGARDIGRVRSINQDSIFTLLTTLPREGSDLNVGLFIVADGMGGHHGGEVASRLAVATAAQYVLAELIVPALADGATEALQPLMIAAVQEANRVIWQQAQLQGTDMGTTCTVALLLGRALYLGHVGDTRAYLATPTGLKLITNDHSTVGRLIQVGQLDPAEARDHPLRSQLYRTVGQAPEVLVDFGYEQLGDATHLLMGSDGLWGLLDDVVMFDVIQHHQWPQDACHELIARANLAGGDDNISAIVVSLPTGY